MSDLNAEQKANALFSIYTSAGLQVVLEIAESIALNSETELLETAPWDKEREGRHAVAFAQRDMFKKMKATIEYMVTDGRLPVEMQKHSMTLEERAAQGAEPVISLDN